MSFEFISGDHEKMILGAHQHDSSRCTKRAVPDELGVFNLWTPGDAASRVVDTSYTETDSASSTEDEEQPKVVTKTTPLFVG